MSTFDTLTPFTVSVRVGVSYCVLWLVRGAQSLIPYNAAFHNWWVAAHFDWVVASWAVLFFFWFVLFF